MDFNLAHATASAAYSEKVGQVGGGVSKPLVELLCEVLAKVIFGSSLVYRQILIPD